MIPMTVTDTSTATTNPYGAYSPGDTGNWSDIGPWFAAVMFGLVLIPFAFKTLLAGIYRVIGVV